MMKFSPLLLILISLWSCQDNTKNTHQLDSPSGINSIEIKLDKEGVLYYSVKHNDKIIIKPSHLGFELEDQAKMHKDFEIIEIVEQSIHDTYELPWGEQRQVKNAYSEMRVFMQEKNEFGRKLNIYFRAFDDGIAFRYEFPRQQTDSLIILDELSQFQLNGDHLCWWIPGDWDIYEHLYNTSNFSKINAIDRGQDVQLAQTYVPHNAVNTPITMRTNKGLYLSFHEANLTNYAGMTLMVDTNKLLMTSELVGSDRMDYKAKVALPFKTPWRTIQIADEAKDLIASNMIINLNEPNKLGNVEWFKPKKYLGIWWDMHIGTKSWDLASGNHGATTEYAKEMIDFAAENDLRGVLIEGWNTGWEHWIGFDDREGVFDFVTPYPDYDLKEVVKYATEKEVEIIMHHETSAAPRTYETQLDTAFSLMKSLGIHSVKTGYVGKILPQGEYHHGQWMVNHYRKVLETAAKYEIAINAHEPIKATGIRRTLPNAISREGLRGQEFNAWSFDGGNPPEHLTIVPFTRMLAGPIDFTPGVFDMTLPTKPKNQINTTLAHQLALYVIIYSPIQMACDLIENYDGHPAFQFIKDVGVDWEQSIVLDGEIGEFVTIARQEKESKNWFLGSITDENPRDIEIDFYFLDENASYEALIYKDGADAHFRNHPSDYRIESITITKGQKMNFHLAAGGGLAISFIKL